MISSKQFEDWANKISKSDKSAFAECFNETYSMYINFSYRYVRSKECAADIVQDAFVILWKERASLEANKSLKNYMFTIVRNCSLNHIRDERMDYLPGNEMTIPDHQHVPEYDQFWNSVLEELPGWIEVLPQRQREIFEMSRYEGLTHKEIAEILDISPQTVNTHINRALSKIRHRLEDYQQKTTYSS